MEREKEKAQIYPSEAQLRSYFTPVKQQALKNSQPQSFITQKITNKMRRIIDEFRKTRRVQMKKKIYGGESKWIFKTQMMIVSQIVPEKFQAFSKEGILPTIAASIKISESSWEKESTRLQEKKARFQYLMQKFTHLKGERVKLKKKIVQCYIRKMKLKFLVAKNNEADNKMQEINNQIDMINTNNSSIRSQLEKNKEQSFGLQKYRGQKAIEIQRISNLITIVSQQIKVKDQKIREISIKRLPNQKQICCCMFSVGILNEQIYILQLHKLLRKQIGSADLQVRKIRNDGKQRQIVSDNGKGQDLNDHILNRKIRIDCRGSEIVVFKVFTVIYMHCKTLYLKNITSIMSKTSFFSQQFKQIYHFQQFQKYMINLIERFKGNQILLQKQQDDQTYSNGRLFIVTGESEFRYLSWILKGFQYVSENNYCVRVGQNKTQIMLLSSYEYSKMPEKHKEAVLKVKFCELNKTSAFD